MPLLIAEPASLRIMGFGGVASGALTTIMAGFQDAAALVGLTALSLGIALLDAVDTGRVGQRQIGLFLVYSAGRWARGASS
jgi:hypothetical protein